jgi:indole-3-glycerol phosphate synthase
MQVLVEIHNEKEADKIFPNANVIGINNRNLHNFNEDFENSIRVLQKLSPHIPVIAESGIRTTDQAAFLLSNGFNGLLIGEHFMRNTRPQQACTSFIRELNRKMAVATLLNEKPAYEN